MAWAFYAIIHSALGSVVSIFDSHILTHRVPDLRSYILPVGLFHLVVALVMLVFQPFPTGAQAWHIVAAFGAGLLAWAGSLMMLNAIRSGEVSRIMPVISSSPIFVALMAMPLLGEQLGLRDWAGILITVAGTVLISLQKDTGRGNASLQRSFLALLLASLLFAVSSILSKYALQTVTYWNLYSASAISLGLVSIIYAARSQTFRVLWGLPDRNHVFSLVLIGQTIIVVSLVISNIAIQQGSVAIVSTILASKPAFVFLYVVLISRFFPRVLNERLTTGIAVLKVTAIAMIVAGITLITL